MALFSSVPAMVSKARQTAKETLLSSFVDFSFAYVFPVSSLWVLSPLGMLAFR